MSQFHGAADNVEVALTVQLSSGTAAPTTLTVSAAHALSITAALAAASSALPVYLTLAAEAESETSAVEVVEVTAINTTTGVLTVAARALDNTVASTWPAGSKLRLDMTSGLFLETQNAVQSALRGARVAKMAHFTRFGNHIPKYQS